MSEQLEFGPNGAVIKIREPIRHEFQVQRYKIGGSFFIYVFLALQIWRHGIADEFNFWFLQILLTLLLLGHFVYMIIDNVRCTGPVMVHERGFSWREKEIPWGDVVAFSFHGRKVHVSVAAPARYDLTAGPDGNGLMLINADGLAWSPEVLETSFAHHFKLSRAGKGLPA